MFAIAGAVFGHYLIGSRREEGEGDAPVRRVSWIGRLGIAGSVAAIAVGLWLNGAPSHSRARELDGMRVNGLRELEAAVGGCYERSGRLPNSLDEVNGGPGVTLGIQRDPETRVRYGYQRVDSLRYRLCARFSGADTLDENGAVIDERWRHAAGAVWFERSVIPDRAHR